MNQSGEERYPQVYIELGLFVAGDGEFGACNSIQLRLEVIRAQVELTFDCVSRSQWDPANRSWRTTDELRACVAAPGQPVVEQFSQVLFVRRVILVL
jgi:hypothetical protein